MGHRVPRCLERWCAHPASSLAAAACVGVCAMLCVTGFTPMGARCVRNLKTIRPIWTNSRSSRASDARRRRGASRKRGIEARGREQCAVLGVPAVLDAPAGVGLRILDADKELFLVFVVLVLVIQKRENDKEFFNYTRDFDKEWGTNLSDSARRHRPRRGR